MSHPDSAIPTYDGPPWVPFHPADDAHHAAHRAFLHTPTCCRLVLLWFSADDVVCRKGYWAWRVVAPDGAAREVTFAEDPPDLFALAEAAIRRFTPPTQQQTDDATKTEG